MGKDDRRAIAILLGLAAAGLVVRFGPLARAGAAPGAVVYRAPDPRPSRDTVAARAMRLARPLRRGETVDLDRAAPEEIARLPRIGPALAGRIADDREANGPFGSLEGLDRVSGVGPGLLAAIKPYAAFSGSPRRSAGQGSAGPSVVDSGSGNRRRTAPPVSLNTATEAELAELPGIGRVRAAAIVADRRTRGPYRALEDLSRIPGIGAATIARLQGRVHVP